jgi:hypothetical protein
LRIQEELVLSDEEETEDEADIGGHLTIPDAEGPHSLLNPQDYTDDVSSPSILFDILLTKLSGITVQERRGSSDTIC